MSKDGKWLQKIQEAKPERVRNRAVPSLPGGSVTFSHASCRSLQLVPNPPLLATAHGLCLPGPSPGPVCPVQHCWSRLLPLPVPNCERCRLFFDPSLSLLICWHLSVDKAPSSPQTFAFSFPSPHHLSQGQHTKDSAHWGEKRRLDLITCFLGRKSSGAQKTMF